jgi:hypothetical protein
MLLDGSFFGSCQIASAGLGFSGPFRNIKLRWLQKREVYSESKYRRLPELSNAQNMECSVADTGSEPRRKSKSQPSGTWFT